MLRKEDAESAMKTQGKRNQRVFVGRVARNSSFLSSPYHLPSSCISLLSLCILILHYFSHVLGVVAQYFLSRARTLWVSNMNDYKETLACYCAAFLHVTALIAALALFALSLARLAHILCEHLSTQEGTRTPKHKEHVRWSVLKHNYIVLFQNNTNLLKRHLPL